MPVFTPLTRSSKGTPLTHNEMDNNWTGLSQIGVYIGSVMPWLTETPPDEWLHLRGQAISRATYSDLFDLLGVMYGEGDGSTTFNLPDFRGRFLRGVDDGSTRDPDRASRNDRGDGVEGDAVGTVQGHQFQSHVHTSGQSGANPPEGALAATPGYGSTSTRMNPAGGNETRPINIYVNWIVKAL